MNIIMPNKNLIHEDWKNVLSNYILAIINARNEQEYTLTMLELTTKIHDTHAQMSPTPALYNHFGRFVAAPMITFIEQKPVVTGFYHDTFGKQSGLMVGDIVTSVNNKPIEQHIKEHSRFTPASNGAVQLRNIARQLLQTNDSVITIEFLRAGKQCTLTLPTYSRQELGLKQPTPSKDTCFRLFSDSIAYIHNGLLKIQYLPELWKTIRQTRGLILDLRNYPMGFPIYVLSAYLMPQSTAFVKFSTGSIQHPGLFTMGRLFTVGQANNDDHYKGKIVVLVNLITSEKK